MQHHLMIARECTVSQSVSPVGDTARPAPRVHFPTHKRPDCRDSRDSLGTVLSETVTMVSLSAPTIIVVACREQLAHLKPGHPPVSH